jgi:hypothetical protein
MKMYRSFILLLLSLAVGLTSFSQEKSEAALMAKLFEAIRDKDSRAYGDIFPGIDSVSLWVLQYGDRNSNAYRRMQMLQDAPGAMAQYDSSINEETGKNFNDFMDRAEGVHWGEAVFLRYELEKVRRGYGLISEKIAPLRFLGYVFFQDLLTQKTYTFTVMDVMQVNGLWYGGELGFIFEAGSKEAFEDQLLKEKKRQRMIAMGMEDTSAGALQAGSGEIDEEEAAKPSSMKQVKERKYYKGKFDNEIPVQLYVRYIKGSCPEEVCSWEAAFKFGDQDEYTKMNVVKTPDGKWLFVEDPENGSMELVLDNGVYTGNWVADDDKTEYDVRMEEVPINPKRTALWDKIMEQGLYGPQ